MSSWERTMWPSGAIWGSVADRLPSQVGVSGGSGVTSGSATAAGAMISVGASVSSVRGRGMDGLLEGGGLVLQGDGDGLGPAGVVDGVERVGEHLHAIGVVEGVDGGHLAGHVDPQLVLGGGGAGEGGGDGGQADIDG